MLQKGIQSLSRESSMDQDVDLADWLLTLQVLFADRFWLQKALPAGK